MILYLPSYIYIFIQLNMAILPVIVYGSHIVAINQLRMDPKWVC